MGRHTAGLSWPFTQQQWHKLLRFLTQVTILDGPKAALVPEVSVIECYMAYLHLDGDVRFQSGTPDASGGGWLSTHLDAFTHGLQFAQGLACRDFLIPRIEKGHPRVTWLRKLGLPPSLKLGPGIIIPAWKQARQKLLHLSSSPPEVEGDAPPNAQLWRRLQVGIPDSQCGQIPGLLSTRPVAWGPPRRLPTKTQTPQWYNEVLDARPFVRFLHAHPLAGYRIGTKTLLDLLSEGGVSSHAQVGHFARALRFQSIRTTRFLAHAKVAQQQKSHISQHASVGERPFCAACSRAGTLTNVFRWLSLPCDSISSGDFDPHPTVRSLEQQLQQTEATHHLLRRLL